jgi:hypothetical protein
VEHAEKIGHLLVKKAVACAVRLDPFAVKDELGNGPFAYMLDDFLSRPRGSLNINFRVSDLVLFKEPFGLAAIPAPRSGIHQNMHSRMISTATAIA